MGIREDQHFGLTYDAIDFLDRRVKKSKITTIREYSNGLTEETFNYELEGEFSGHSYTGMYGDKYPLYKYQDRKTEEYYHEYIQREFWDSGPVFFMALRKDNGDIIPESLWTICEKCNFPASICDCEDTADKKYGEDQIIIGDQIKVAFDKEYLTVVARNKFDVIAVTKHPHPDGWKILKKDCIEHEMDCKYEGQYAYTIKYSEILDLKRVN